MNATEKKAAKKRLAELRRQWRDLKRAVVVDPTRLDLYLICPVNRNRYSTTDGEPKTCADPTCEGCAATLHRSDRMREIEAEASALKAQLDPDPTAA